MTLTSSDDMNSSDRQAVPHARKSIYHDRENLRSPGANTY